MFVVLCFPGTSWNLIVCLTSVEMIRREPECSEGRGFRHRVLADRAGFEPASACESLLGG